MVEFDAIRYFGTVPRALFALFATGPEPLNICPVIESMPEMMLFFTLLIVMTTFGLLNVIIGAIVEDTVNASKWRRWSRRRISPGTPRRRRWRGKPDIEGRRPALERQAPP